MSCYSHRMRIRFGVLAMLCILAGLPGCGPAQRHPNVILIVLDTVRSDHLSCYGYERPTSPNVDRLARESVMYTKAIAAAPWTLPSHASMFTGLVPSRHMAHNEHLVLEEDQQTLAEVLAASGFETAGFCNNPWLTGKTGMTQGFEQFHEVWRDVVSQGTININLFVNPAVHGMEDAGAATSLGQITAWLGERPKNARPFFLFVNLIEPHSYYDPPPDFRNRFTGASLSREEVAQANLDYVRHAFADSLTAPEVDRIQALYDGEIAYVDDWVGKLLAFLREHALLDRSLLIVTSDHGEAFGEHQLCGVRLIDHQLSLHQELLRVPLIVRYPRGAQGGARIDAPVTLCDIFATALEVAGVPVPPGLDGEPLPRDPAKARHDREIDSEYYRPLMSLGLLSKYIAERNRLECLANHRLASVQQGGRKVIMSSEYKALRYDLARDPEERSPLPPPTAPDPLVGAAVKILGQMEESKTLPPPELEPALYEALHSLGYVK
jgi:arylsulfatase A-like enzyme